MNGISLDDGAAAARRRAARIAGVMGAVLEQALADAGAAGLIVTDVETPEGGLLRRWAAEALGEQRLTVVSGTVPPDGVVRELARSAGLDGVAAGAVRDELRRAIARVLAARDGGVCADPSNKTALLLGDAFPAAPLLPLGDLYASMVRELCGGWSAPEPVRRLAELSGGIERLDRALADWIDRRESADRALASLPEPVRWEVVQRVRRGRWHRRRLGLVPKLGARTIGIDLLW